MANIKSIYGNPVVDDALRQSVATEYSSSSTYAVGDFCLKDGVLYKCSTAISTAEAWTAAHWTAVTVGGELSSVKNELSHISGLSDDVKQALLQIAEKVAYIDGDGQDYYDDLYNSLYSVAPVELISISAVYTQSGTVYDTDSLDSLKSDIVVTATYDDSTTKTVTSYTLSGTLTEGTSTITVSYGGKTTNFNVVVSISLDSIAYGTLTYRQLFITDNLITLGDYESAMTIDNTWRNAGNNFNYKKNAGSPALSTEYANSPTHSLKCFGTGSTQIAYSNSTDAFSGSYLCCVAVKVDRYSAGKAGIQVVTPLQSSVEQSAICVQEVTDGFVPVVEIHTTAASRTGMGVYMGTYSSANCDAYVDDVVVTPLPSGLTKADALTLYTKYLGLRRTA